MKRLTEKCWRNLDPWECCGQDNYCKRGCHEKGGCNNGCIVPRVYCRLAAYEDTGLEPEEVCKLRDVLLDQPLGKVVGFDGVSIDRLLELVEAEKAGRLEAFPCMVGDQLWYYPKWYAKSGFAPEPLEVEEVNSYSGVITVMCYMDPDTKIEATADDFGKTVFLTREEAEAALEALTGGGEG